METPSRPKRELFPVETLISLADLLPGQSAVIRRISNQEPEMLRSLARLKLVPGQALTLLERNDFNDTITLELGTQKTEIISTRVAQTIDVKVFPTDPLASV